MPVSFSLYWKSYTSLQGPARETSFNFKVKHLIFYCVKHLLNHIIARYFLPNCFCIFKQFINVCWMTLFGAVLLLCLCCLWMYTIERAACTRLPWEDFLICGFWPACHSLEAIHELSVLAISAKTLDAKISLDAVVQKEGNLGVWGVRQDKASQGSVNTYLLNSIYFSRKK